MWKGTQPHLFIIKNQIKSMPQCHFSPIREADVCLLYWGIFNNHFVSDAFREPGVRESDLFDPTVSILELSCVHLHTKLCMYRMIHGGTDCSKKLEHPANGDWFNKPIIYQPREILWSCKKAMNWYGEVAWTYCWERKIKV